MRTSHQGHQEGAGLQPHRGRGMRGDTPPQGPFEIRRRPLQMRNKGARP
nr:MAG TPA: hypothetical protein [Caudoviricetes sp.]